jgi:hypothetical protein
LNSFWGEQKPVSTLVETGFNFFSDFFATASFLVCRNKKSSFANQLLRPKKIKIKIKNLLASQKPQATM